jgi:hypothetical protein
MSIKSALFILPSGFCESSRHTESDDPQRVKAVTHIVAGKQAAVTQQEGLIYAANHGCSESLWLTEINAARAGLA